MIVSINLRVYSLKIKDQGFGKVKTIQLYDFIERQLKKNLKHICVTMVLSIVDILMSIINKIILCMRG